MVLNMKAIKFEFLLLSSSQSQKINKLLLFYYVNLLILDYLKSFNSSFSCNNL